MGYELTGTIMKVFETEQVSERFTKREFVVETADNPKYPQVILIQITGDKVSQLDGIGAGDEVHVEFSVRGREWKSPQGDVKYFVTLAAWKVERVGARGLAGKGADSSPVEPPIGTNEIPF